MLHATRTLAAAFILASTALAQGGNSCATPDPTAGVGLFPYDTTTATTSGFDGGNPAACTLLGSRIPDRDVFFAWTATSAGVHEFSNCGADTPSQLTLHLGSDCNAVCLDMDNESCCGAGAAITTDVLQAGDVYLVQLGQWPNSAPGHTGNLRIWIPAPPTNDTCAAPTPLVGLGTFPIDLGGATTSGFNGGDPLLCQHAQNQLAPAGDIFFSWTAPSAGAFEIDTCASVCDTVLNVHSGLDCAATCLTADNDGQCLGSGPSRAVIDNVLAGDVFLIQLGLDSNLGVGGAGALNIAALANPLANDSCATPTPLSGFGTTPVDITGASTSFLYTLPGNCLFDRPLYDLFYEWTATSAGQVQFNYDMFGFDSDIIQVYSGSGCNVTCVDFDTSSGPGASAQVRVGNVQPGDRFVLQCGSNTAPEYALGELIIGPWSAPPTHDTCSSPLAISGLGPFPYSNYLAGTSGFVGGNPAVCDVTASQQVGPTADLFFAWTAPCSGSYTIHNCGAPNVFDTAISVHQGTDCGATCISSSVDASQGCTEPWLAEVSFVATSGQAYLIQMGGATATSLANDFDWAILMNSGVCPTTTLINVCNPANAHDQGGRATMVESSFTGPGGSLHLECTDGPVGEFGLFIVSQITTGGSPLSNGLLCLGLPLARYDNNAGVNLSSTMNSLGVFDATGRFTSLVGNSASGSGFDVPAVVPMLPANPTIAPGDAWFFQCWFRDQPVAPATGTAANLSDVVLAQF